MNRYARIGVYTNVTNVQEAIEKVTTSALPKYKEQPGFVSYDLVQTGETTLVSTSIWETEEAAQKASEMMAQWTTENLPASIVLEKDYNGNVVVNS